jgi:hypothetical protein
VAACTDSLPGDTRERKSPWGDRKRRYLAQLASAGRALGSSPRATSSTTCARWSPICASTDVPTLGRFTASPERTRWYYESAHALLRDALPRGIRASSTRDRSAARLHRARRGAMRPCVRKPRAAAPPRAILGLERARRIR